MKRSFPFLILVLWIGPAVLLAHLDCEYSRVMTNLRRMCKAYPNIKRSTPDLTKGGYWNREFGGGRNPGRGPPYGPVVGYPGDGGVVFRGMYPEAPGNLMYPEGQQVWQTGPEPRMEEEYSLDWLFNPLDYGGENQLPLERWRRDKHVVEEIRRFVTEKCCQIGCPFPSDYIELDRRTNLCGFR